MFFLLVSIQVFSLSLLEPLGEIFLRPNEIYTDNLLRYFTGDGQDFSVFIGSPDPNPALFFKNETNLILSSFYAIPGGNNSAFTKFPLWFQNNSNYFIFYNETSLWIYQLSAVSGEIELQKEYSIFEVLDDGKITQVVKSRSWVFVLITRVEVLQGHEFNVSEVLYFSSDLGNLEVCGGNWDFKYQQKVTLGLSQHDDYLAVGAITEYDEKVGFIMIYLMDTPEIMRIVQVIHSYYLFVNVENIQTMPLPIDLVIQNGYLLVLNYPNSIISFVYTDGVFIENGMNDLSFFEELVQFGTIYDNSKDSQLLPVISQQNIIIYGIQYNSNEFVFFSDPSQPSITLSQSIYPYFFYSYESENDLIFCISKIVQYRNELIFRVPLKSMTSDLSHPRPWLVVPDFKGNFYLMIQDVLGVRVLTLSIASFYFQVSSEESSVLDICAKDAEFSICSNLILNITSSVGPLILNRYRNVSEVQTNIDVYFYTEDVFIVFTAQDYMIGSEIDYYIGQNDSFYFSYFAEKYKVLTFLERTETIIEYSNGGFYGFDYYLIDKIGFVYINFTLTIDIPGAVDLDAVNHLSKEIVILYPDSLLFYSGYLKNSTILQLPESCRYLRTVDSLVMCASKYSLFVITSTTSFNQFLVSDDPIIDFTFTQSQDFNFIYVFVLTSNSIRTFELNDEHLVQIDEQSYEAYRVFAYSSFLCILGDSFLNVYDLLMTMQFKQININSNFLGVKMVENILSVQYTEKIMIYDILAPQIGENPVNFNTSDCRMSGYQHNFYLLLCPLSIDLIRTTCPPSCISSSIFYFSLSNISSVVKGYYSLVVPVDIQIEPNPLTLELTFHIYTYAAATFFDYEGYSKNMGIAYNEKSSLSLEYLVNGYNLECSLLINNETVNFSNPSQISTYPVVIIDRVTETNLFNSSETILDFAIVEKAGVVFVLTVEKLLVFDEIQGFNYSFIKTLTPSWVFDVKDDLFFGACQTIQHITRTKEHCLFVSICSGYEVYDNYYDGQELQVDESSTSIVIFQYDLVNHTIDLSLDFQISYNISFLKVITGDPKNFLIVTGTPRIGLNNNYIYLYKGFWYGPSIYFLSLNTSINFYSLGLPKFFAQNIDGIYQQATKNSKENIVIYVADAYFGIRVLQVSKEGVFILQNISFYLDAPTSVAVCGSILYVTTSKTYFLTYLISDFLLQLYNTHPASPLDEFSGISSSISCSDYYFPTFISYLLKNSTSSHHYKLRIISSRSTFNSSVMSDIDIECTNCMIKKTKSLFIDGSSLVYLNNNNSTMSVLYLSPATLLFPKMSKKNYLKMIKIYKKPEFELIIQLKHLTETLNSSIFKLVRSGPQSFDFDAKNKNYSLYYLLIPGIFIPLIIIITIFAYKKIFKTKRRTVPVSLNPRVVKLQMVRTRLRRLSIMVD